MILPDAPIVGLIVFGVILAGALAGWAMGQLLPAHHITDETKSVVSVSMAVVATVSALVLGLLISNANTSFIARNGQVTALSANILRLDQMLRLYGPEADPAREALRKYAEHKTADLFPESPEATARIDNQSTYEMLQRVETLLLRLHPSDQRQQWMVTQALTLASNIGNTRWLLVQENGDRTPKAFLGLVVFWLTLLFASFGLFAPRNWTAAIALMLCALAVSGAVEMIIELEQPFGGLIQISPQSMRYAVDTLGEQSTHESYGSGSRLDP